MLAFAVAAERASACVCAQDHPAGRLAFAPAAIVGVVEEADGGNHVIRVERAVKGDLAGRVTVTSQLTSCQALLEKGARVGLILGGEPGAWDLIQCNVFDPDALIAAGALPPPSGATRFIAAVQAEGLDAVALGARGVPAGYGLPQGTPLAVAGCGDGVVQAMRRDGKVHVFTRAARGLVASVTSEVPVREVLALGCVGDTTWVVGRDELVSVRPGEPARIRMDRRPATAAAIVGSRAYIAHGDLLRVYPLKGSGSLRATRYDGVFVQLSVRGNRVAGRLRDGRGAVLDLASGHQRTAAISGSLAWLSGNRLVDSGPSVTRGCGSCGGSPPAAICSPSRRARRTSATAMSSADWPPAHGAPRASRTFPGTSSR